MRTAGPRTGMCSAKAGGNESMCSRKAARARSRSSRENNSKEPRAGLIKVKVRQKSLSDLARKKQSSRPKLTPVIKVGVAEGDTIVSAVPGKAGPSGRDSSVRKVLKILGPGLVTAADDDPSGIATYSSVGAQFGYSMLWDDAFYLSVHGRYSGD